RNGLSDHVSVEFYEHLASPCLFPQLLSVPTALPNLAEPPRRSRRRTRSRPRPPGAAARPAGRPWPPSRLSAMVAGHVTLLTPMAHTGHVLAQHHTPSGEMAPRSRSSGMCSTSPD